MIRPALESKAVLVRSAPAGEIFDPLRLENIKILQCIDRSYPAIGGLENAVRDMQRCVSLKTKGHWDTEDAGVNHQ